MAEHWTLGKVRLLEGIANIILSIILLRHYGILGVAMGTAIPMLVSSIVFLPLHLCRKLHMDLGQFLKETYIAPALLCIPMAFVLFLLERNGVAHTLLQLLKQTCIGGLTYAIGVVWYLSVKEPAGVELRMKVLQFIAAERRQ